MCAGCGGMPVLYSAGTPHRPHLELVGGHHIVQEGAQSIGRVAAGDLHVRSADPWKWGCEGGAVRLASRQAPAARLWGSLPGGPSLHRLTFGGQAHWFVSHMLTRGSASRLDSGR